MTTNTGQLPLNLIERIDSNTPTVFAKFGDGEYFAAIGESGGNCDHTPYTPRLGEGIRNAFRFLHTSPSVFFGCWHSNTKMVQFFESLVDSPVPWVDYHTFIFKPFDEFMTKGVSLYRAIRFAKQQKIYVCNPFMVEGTRQCLRIDNHVPVHPHNWFETSYESTLASVESAIRDPNHVMILTSAGMGAKVLIADLHRKYPNAIILDIGSALDNVCSPLRTRDYHRYSTAQIRQIWAALTAE